MPRIPDKHTRPAGSVQIRIAGRESPTMGKVSRITNDARDLERGRKSRSRKRQRSTSRRSSRRHGGILRRWLVLALTLAGVTLGAVLVWTLTLQGRIAPATTGKPAISPISPWASAPPLEASEATRIVSRMLAAKSPEDLEILLRDSPTQTAKAINWVRDFHEGHPSYQKPIWLGTFDSICAPIHFVMLRRPEENPLMVPLTTGLDNEWRIDFEAMIGQCAPDFGQWLAGAAESGVVRALGTEDYYFNGSFRDDAIWACYSLSHPDHDSWLYGYCQRGSPQQAAIQAIIRRNQLASIEQTNNFTQSKAFRVTLKLLKPEAQAGRQYEIMEVISDDWVIGNTSLENLLLQREEAAR